MAAIERKCAECGECESVHTGSWQWCPNKYQKDRLYKYRPKAFVPKGEQMSGERNGGVRMSDKVEGFLEVGTNEKGEVVINHPDLKPDENGVGHIVFSVNQARNLANSLRAKADEAEREKAGR